MATSKAVYIGNNEGEYYGFTVGRNYDVLHYGNDNIWVVDDDFCPRSIKNGAFHKFKLIEDDFATENERASKAADNNKKPYLRYYINGYAASQEEFEDVKSVIANLNMDGVKCDTIKFEVKFE
ncbi:TPA: hypothetical protein IF905_005086 [Escherichia coli]|nr:hypothetical protein [Escherichia coli]